MRFKSKFAAFRVHCRNPQPAIYDAATGHMTREAIRRLDAEFAVHSGEFIYHDVATGRQEMGAEIRGFIFDSEVAQQEHDWSDEERAIVERVLLETCDRMPEFVQPYEAPRIAAPWPTYDTTPETRIPELALELGVVEHALGYEQQNKNRPEVISVLSVVSSDAEEPDDDKPEPEDDPEAAALIAA